MMVMATKGFNGNPQLFFGLNVGPWKTGQLLGDADAMKEIP